MANVEILHTGMTQCFDAQGSVIDCRNSGQDAAVGAGLCCSGPRFNPISAEIIEDNLTGLLWSRDCSLFEYPLSWKDSLAFIEQMNREQRFDRSDWRLPNRREMRSLIDHSRKKPALPGANPFVNINLGWYWTSTNATRNAAYAWYVHLEGGRMVYGKKSDYYWFWPVAGTSSVLTQTGEQRLSNDGKAGRLFQPDKNSENIAFGVPWPHPRFHSKGDEVYDSLTGLIWQVVDTCAQPPVNWQGGLEAAGLLAQRSGKPWRMPTINELESLVDASEHDPALPLAHPFRARQQGYWSSTTSGFEKDWAYVLYMDKGAVGVGFKKKGEFYLWPVMSP